jgi:hypothetical protein
VLELITGGELFDRISEKTVYNEKDARDLVGTLLVRRKHLARGDTGVTRGGACRTNAKRLLVPCVHFLFIYLLFFLPSTLFYGVARTCFAT